jgi:hypothetical protein
VSVALALLLLVLGGFTAVVARRMRPGASTEQVRGFCYVGAVACLAVGVAAMIVGLLAGQGQLAEGIAMLGLFGYVVYLLAALTILTWPARHWPRRTIPPVHRRNRSPKR